MAALTMRPMSKSCLPVVFLGKPASFAENLDLSRISLLGKSHICTLTMSLSTKSPLQIFRFLKSASAAYVMVACYHIFFISILNRTIDPNLAKTVLIRCSVESRGISVTLIDCAGINGCNGVTSRGKNVRFSSFGNCTAHA